MQVNRSISAETQSAENEVILNLNNNGMNQVQDQGQEEEEEEEEEEFSFVGVNPSGSLISAEDIFQNGQIRPIFPLYNRDDDGDLLLFVDDDKAAARGDGGGPLMFVDERNEAQGPSCVWTGGSKALADKQICKKSNSTGFSKLRRFREFVLRSNSDGKDAFVFLNHNKDSISSSSSSSSHHSTTTTTTTSTAEKNGTTGNEEEKKKKKKDAVVVKNKEQSSKRLSSSPHELHYLRNRAVKDGDKQKSYLPYRQDIFGFFTNVNDLSRNIHPF